MKIGLFTDAHYSSAELTCGKRYNSKSLHKIEEAYRHFERNGCGLIVFLGDLTDTEPTHELETQKLKEIAAVMNTSSIPTVCMMGNHDAFDFTEEEFYEVLGAEHKPINRTAEGKRLIFLDACYFKSGRRYAPGDSDWTDTYCPFAKQLQIELANYPMEAIVFLHQNIDPSIPENHRLSNDAEIRSILETSPNPITVFQGHYHPGKQSVHNGIKYITLPAMCENENARWIIGI